MFSKNSALEHWLALIRLPEVGPVTANKLLDRFGKPEAIFSEQLLQDLKFYVKPSTYAAIRQYVLQIDRCPIREQVKRDLEWLDNQGVALLTIDAPAYPPLLKQIHSAPPLLFVKGRLDLLSAPQLGVVGSRNPTVTGRENAFQFAKDINRLGLVISSGMALGIDAYAHQGALAAEGETIAVLGTGIDQIYPRRHQALAERIVERGALVSEFPLHTEPGAQNFPRRNRIISGLSLGVLVVEAALKSGSLITAQYALDQNREVFAIPGSIHNPMAKGCHSLIRQGAKLVESAEHIIEELNHLAGYSADLQNGDRDLPRADHINTLSAEEQRLLELIGDELTSIDQIIARSGLDTAVVISTLLMLELKGRVECQAGQYQLCNTVVPNQQSLLID